MRSSPAGPVASLRGDQQPRILSVPPYATTAGDEAIELARLAGVELDPWQQMELRHGMGESADWKCPSCTYRSASPQPCAIHPDAELIHPWAAFEVCSVCTRQNGKSELLIARQLAGMFLLEEPLQIYSAHLFDTSLEIFRRLVFLVENCDDLRKEVKHRGSKLVGIKNSHGEEGIELRGGLRIRFKARTAGGGRGFSCDTLYLDEAMILREGFLGATVPTLSARANPQIWLAGSAADEEDPAHEGVVLAKRRVRAIEGGDTTLVYFEHSAEGEDPGRVPTEVLDDPEQWARANPSLGIRITTEYVKAERAAMGSRQFAVERLGIGAWPDVSESAGMVISREAWAQVACSDESQRIEGRKVFGLDSNPQKTWGSISVAGHRPDELFHVALVDHERGIGWIVERCKELKREHRRARFVLDKLGPLSSIIDDLKAAKLDVIEAGTDDYGRACGGFFDAVIEKRVRYPAPQPELDEALAAAVSKPLGDRWKWDRKNSTSADISPIVSATLALWGAEQVKPKPRVIDLAAALREEAEREAE